MAGDRIRIRMEAYDHRVLDQSAAEIVETSKRTGGVNSWGTVYPSSGNTPPSANARAAFIKEITDVIDAAWTAAGEAADHKATKKLVILMHDVRTPDRDDIGNIIDEIETYAGNKGVELEYKRVKDF